MKITTLLILLVALSGPAMADGLSESADGQKEQPKSESRIELAAQTTTVYPTVTTEINLSAKDQNWIICSSGDMEDIITSGEKGLLEPIYSGKNVFLKFDVKKRMYDEIYMKAPTEILAICGGEVYKMIALPKMIPSQTIRLGSQAAQSVEANLTKFSGLEYEERLFKLIQEAYRGDTALEAYKAMDGGLVVPTDLPVTIKLSMAYEVEGVGLVLKVFRVETQDAVELYSSDFYRWPLGVKSVNGAMVPSKTNVAAVALEKHIFNAGETTRVFVVERKEGK